MSVSFIAWSTILGEILTMNNLRKQHVIVVDWSVFVRGVWNLWIIFFSTVRLVAPIGVLSLVVMGYLGYA
jgi:hypothetical protein